jgi:hypothetical protein
MLFGAIALVTDGQNVNVLVEHYVKEKLVRTIAQGLIEKQKM